MEIQNFAHTPQADESSARSGVSRQPTVPARQARRFPPPRRLTILLALLSTLTAGGAQATGIWDSGPEVAQIQRALGLPATGGFGPRTEAAVRRFQQAHGLAADGIVGPETRQRLLGSASDGASDEEFSACPQGGAATQALLQARGFYSGAIDGVCGTLTQTAILAAQQAHGLTQDGVAGVETLQALHTGASQGSNATDVAELQRLLTNQGFYRGSLDGVYGSETQAAVLAAQRFHGLTEDGVAGAQTLAILSR